jgi:epoxyqueuosine reductase
MSSRPLNSDVLQELAEEVGLDLVGAVPAGPSPTWEAYRAWIKAGYAGGMDYLAREDAMRRRRDPRHIMPDAQTVLVVAASYAAGPLPPLAAHHGRVSRYAWGEDYHRWLLHRLKALVRGIEGRMGIAIGARTYVDTGPVLERAWAEAAGLGWTGKNTTLIHPRLGSYTFLGTALLDVAIPPTPRRKMPSCGTCTRCIEACPTGAILAPGRIDARRCLSYLTIEHRGAIPATYREAMRTRVFGCDTCQEVCPWNRRPIAAHRSDAVPKHGMLYLPDLLTMDKGTFRARFRRTPIWRATPEGLARNAAVVLGNLGDAAARPYLARAADAHSSELVREHARWALEQIA